MTEKAENVSRKYNFSPLEMRLDRETGKVRGQGKRKKPHISGIWQGDKTVNTDKAKSG